MAVRQIAAAGAARRASHGGCLQASFEEGEYSATDLDSPPSLTINAPIGLNLRDNPAEIVNRSRVQNNNNAEEIIGLNLSSGNNLTLVGGEINLEGGSLSVTKGRIELGGLSQVGTVTFNSDGSLSFPIDAARADVTLSNAAMVNVTGTGGGDVAIDARNLKLQAGELGDSAIVVGISPDSTDPRAQAGDITINATENVTVDNSIITNQVTPEAEGDGGDVTITTDTLSVTGGGQVSASTGGRGNAGGVEITATDSIAIDGENSQSFPSGAFSQVAQGAEGSAGDITITTDTLSVTGGGQVSASTFGRGNAGGVEITATDSIVIDDEDPQGNSSSVASQVNRGAKGDGGNVTITTDTLSVTNGGQVGASTFGQGNGGNVEIIARDSIAIDGETLQEIPSGAFSQAESEAVGDGGDVTITTDTLSVTNAGIVSASSFGRGNAGEVNIKAGSIRLDGDNATISSSTSSGNGGIVNLEVASTITLDNDSSISAQAFEEADGGNLSIDAEFIVAFPNGSNDLIAAAKQGQGGNISINAESILGIQERPLSGTTNDINASSSVSGLDGTVDITTTDINPIEGATELPSNPVVPQQTTQQACQSNREAAAQNGLNIEGKGGVPPAPELPLNSLNAITNGETNSASTIPAPIETSRGKIQPARGIEVTPSGTVKLTAYPTNNKGDRLPEIKPNCGI